MINLQSTKLAALCDVACALSVPEFGTELCVTPARLKGGIIQTIISRCDLDWTPENIEDYVFWQNAADAADELKGTGRQKGGGFNFTAQTEDTDACRPPELTGGTWSVTIKDFNVILADAADVSFWNQITSHPGLYQVGFRTAQDYFYGFFPLTISDKKLTLPDDCKQLFFREITFQWYDLNEPPRYYLSFLNSIFPI